MYCWKCGEKNSNEAVFCKNCGTNIVNTAEEKIIDEYKLKTKKILKPAGFALRLAARIIDNIIINMILVAIFSLYVLIKRPEYNIYEIFKIYNLFCISFILFVLLYNTILESSITQATFGKKILGLYVGNLEGRKISFWRAFGRNLSKNISGIILGIGFFMALFSEKKQCLHDIIVKANVYTK